MDAVASFKRATSLQTDKKVNLIYGLNGTGKSTLSNFLYDPKDPQFSQCRMTQDQHAPILVYNQKFIRDNFFVADSLNGIFSLSKENKAAEEKIAEGKKRQAELELALRLKQGEKQQIEKDINDKTGRAEEEVWSIKKTYTGGDRVLEYCLEGLKGQKQKVLAHLQAIPKPAHEPHRRIEAIRKDVESLKGDGTQSQHRLATLSFQAHEVEADQIFGSAILGNADSEVAALIEELGNADWVSQGLAYIPNEASGTEAKCPFCQESTITAKFISKLKSYFDLSYLGQLDELDRMLRKYQAAIDNLSELGEYTKHAFAQEHNELLSSKYQLFLAAARGNIVEIEKKIQSPRSVVLLTDTSGMVEEFNNQISAINQAVDEHNRKLQNREAELAKLRDEFWQLMRWQYDQTILRLEQDLHAANEMRSCHDAEIASINDQLMNAKERIAEAQRQTVNTDAAVDAINAGLLDLGIDDFVVRKHSDSDNLYRVVRPGGSDDAFHSLSEGEKMMISFLYFCELCKGMTGADDTHAQRVVVIDDPISSLSHIFIFNVGQLIRSVFFKEERYCQVIVLTHSLYFFYELADINHERRKSTQKLFRLSKPSSGSVIQEMKYEEIQNDYQAYWSVVNDRSQPPALIANCMRNIIEYFFNFVRKKDLNNVFQMPELQDNKYQAFCRYINRESHSLGQNILDMKEFDYDIFREGLMLVFGAVGYADHFKAMSKC